MAHRELIFEIKFLMNFRGNFLFLMANYSKKIAFRAILTLNCIKFKFKPKT